MLYTFTLDRHEEFENSGWRMDGQPEFDPLGGMAVAHDILEHFPGLHSQATAQEMLALGAAIWIRLEDGYYAMMTGTGSARSVDENIGYLPMDIWQNRGHQAYTLPKPPRVEVPDVIEYAEKEFHGQRNSMIVCDGLEHGAIPPWDVCKRWLAKGYELAERRYSRVTEPYRLCELFVNIERIADMAITELEHYEAGPKLKLDVCVKNNTVKSWIREDYDDVPWRPFLQV